MKFRVAVGLLTLYWEKRRFTRTTAFSLFWIAANFADGQQLVHFSFDGVNITTNPLVDPGSNSSAYGELQVHVFNMHCCCSWKFVLQSSWNDKWVLWQEAADVHGFLNFCTPYAKGFLH